MRKCAQLTASWIVMSVFVTATDAVDQLIRADHWKRARPVLEATLLQNPNDTHALAQMARLTYRSGDLEGAEKLAKQLLGIDDKNVEAHLVLANVLAERANNAGLFASMKLAKSLRHELDAAVAANPASVEAHRALMEFFLEAPGMAGGDKGRARDEAFSIARLDPVRGLVAQGDYEAHEKSADADALYRKARDSAGSDYSVVAIYCNYLLNQKKWDESEKCANDLIKLAPDRVAGYSMLAIAYTTQQQWKDLDSAISDAEKNVPDNLSPEFQAARILAGSGADYQRAERYLRKYLSQDPEPGYPKLSRAHWRLGQVLEKQGRKPEAIAEFETATRMEPEFKPATNDLKQLR